MADPKQFDDLQQLAEYGNLLETQLQGLLRATGQFNTLIQSMIATREAPIVPPQVAEAISLLAPGAGDRTRQVQPTLPHGVAKTIADRMSPEAVEFREAARKELLSRIEGTPHEKLKETLLAALDDSLAKAGAQSQPARSSKTGPQPTPQVPAGPTRERRPTPDEHVTEESDPTVRARLALTKLFYGVDSIFTRYLAASVIAHGRGNISPTDNPDIITSYQEDMLQLEPQVAVTWPTGFYRNNDTKGAQFFLNMEKEHQFSILLSDLSKDASPVYVVSYKEIRDLRDYPSVQALQVIHDKTLEALKALALKM